jgi:hypothetical protein
MDHGHVLSLYRRPRPRGSSPRLAIGYREKADRRTLLVAAVAGALMWASSPWLTGHREPWGADGFFYVGAMAVAGAVAGVLAPKPLWAHYVGAFTGQLMYEALFLKTGPLFIVGVVFLLGYSVIFALAASIAARVRLVCLKR